MLWMKVHAHDIGSLVKGPYNSFGKVILGIDIGSMCYTRKGNLQYETR
jgi:hypothetical protein